jgi:hypothetical protein
MSFISKTPGKNFKENWQVRAYIKERCYSTNLKFEIGIL